MFKALGGKNIADMPKPVSPTSDSLPSLSSSSPRHLSDEEDVKEIKDAGENNSKQIHDNIKQEHDRVLGQSDSETDDDVTLMDSSGVSDAANNNKAKIENQPDDIFTGIQTNKKSYSPVDLDGLSKVKDTSAAVNFNILPGKIGDGSGELLHTLPYFISTGLNIDYC